MKPATLTAVSLPVLLGLLLGPASAQTQPPPRPAAVRPPSPTPVGTSGTSNAAPDYRLAPGDKLRIEVYKDSQLSQSLQIRPDGKITLPLLGDMTAAGRTSLELRDAISSSLNDYITDPVVTVIVVETTPQVVYVTGEVNHPGALPIPSGHITILQALAMAGGFTDFADRKDIRILRKSAAGIKVLRFNYKDALDDEATAAPLQLVSGDTVVVK